MPSDPKECCTPIILDCQFYTPHYPRQTKGLHALKGPLGDDAQSGDECTKEQACDDVAQVMYAEVKAAKADARGKDESEARGDCARRGLLCEAE